MQSRFVYGGWALIGPDHVGRPVNIAHSSSKVMVVPAGDLRTKSVLHVVSPWFAVVATLFSSSNVRHAKGYIAYPDMVSRLMCFLRCLSP